MGSMEDVSNTNEQGRNLIGIVPIAGYSEFDFGQPWPNCMMPIGPSFSLVEAAVAECAWAGCQSIWVVVNDDFAPLIKKSLGDWCQDPVWSYRKYDPVPGESKRRIPIYYTGINPKDRFKRDCVGWSIIHGALTAFKIMSGISKWMIPSKYYVSFPHGYFPAYQLREHRKIINSDKNICITSRGSSVKDNLRTSFTFGKDDWLEFRRVIRTGTGMKVPGTDYRDDILLPPEERWSARYFPISKVFEPLDLDTCHKIEVENYFNITTWEEYSDFIAASRKIVIKRPSKSILTAARYNRVCRNYLEDDEGET